MNRDDLFGRRFGRWLVTGERCQVGGKAAWRCVCDCGTIKFVQQSNLLAGRSSFCRQNNEFHATEYRSVHRYRTMWRHMIARCHDPANKYFAYYGGRGIRVCESWRNSFAAFSLDMGPRPKALQIDRIDNNGHYEPGNCRWVSRKENVRNRRNTLFLEWQGRKKPLAEWAELVGLPRNVVTMRVSAGWTAERALTEPVRGRKSA